MIGGKSGIFHKSARHGWTQTIPVPYTPIDRQDRITHVDSNMYLLYTITYPDDATHRTWYDRLMASYMKR